MSATTRKYLLMSAMIFVADFLAAAQTNIPQGTPQTESLFFVYSIVFKLLVILAGVTSIVLGYRLYAKGIVSADAKHSSLKASFAKTEILLKNVAPGTFFALFGAVLIVFLIQFSSPELRITSSPSHLSLAAGAAAKEIQMPDETRTYLRSIVTDKMGSVFKALDEHAIDTSTALQKLRDIYDEER